MNFLNGLSQAKEIIGAFVSNGQTTGPNGQPIVQPRGVIWARYIARLAILFMALFIFMWWPVDSFTPEGFDAWSERMANLPQEVWYVLLGVIMSWGTTEVMAARAMKAASPTGSSSRRDDFSDFDDTGGMFDGTPLDGRFANANDGEGEDFFDNSGEPNPEIEQWRNDNAAQ